MKSFISILFVVGLLSACVHNNDSSESGHLELEVFFLDYGNNHLKMNINGDEVFNRLVARNNVGTGINGSFVINTPRKLKIEFCVDGECIIRILRRRETERYLIIKRLGPITETPPFIKFSRKLRGLD